MLVLVLRKLSFGGLWGVARSRRSGSTGGDLGVIAEQDESGAKTTRKAVSGAKQNWTQVSG